MNKLPSFYTVIPAFVRYNKALADFDKLLYGEIAALTNANNYCWASNKYFARVFSKSERSITRSVTNLINAGVISSHIDPKDGNTRILTLKTPIDKNVHPPIDKNVPSRARQRTKKNNTRYNNGYSPSIDWFKDYLEAQDTKAGGAKDRKH